MITIFKNLTHTKEPFFISFETALNRIRSGKDSELINAIRMESDKAKRNELKKGLPAILFSGKFLKREDSAMIEHSGKIVLDFDNFKDITEVSMWRKNLLKSYKNRFVNALFLSPSGLGIKIIVRIKPCTESEHKGYFKALQKYFNDEHFDSNCSNVGRICYSSFDPDLICQPESEIFTEIVEEAPYIAPPMPEKIIQSEISTLKCLQSWFEKAYKLVEGENVNSSLFVLSKALCEYRVSKQLAESHILNFYGNSENIEEIKSIIKSAYSKPGVLKVFVNRRDKNITIQTGNGRIGHKGRVTWTNVDYSDKEGFQKCVSNEYPEWKYFTVYDKASRKKLEVVQR
jgi:hypothetical protein